MTDWNLSDLDREMAAQERRAREERLARCPHPEGCRDCACYERGRLDGLASESLVTFQRHLRWKRWRDRALLALAALWVLGEWIVWAR